MNTLVDAGFPGAVDRDPPEYQSIDMDAVRAYRLARVRAELVKRNIAGALLTDPLNVRYATDSTNMQVWILHNAARYVFVPAYGPFVLFDFHNSEHRSLGLNTVDEVRLGTGIYYFASGPALAERAGRWAQEIDDLLRRCGGDNRRLGLDRANPVAVAALQALGIEVCDGTEVMEHARRIKSAGEIQRMRASIAVCETAIHEMRTRLAPGMTENALW